MSLRPLFPTILGANIICPYPGYSGYQFAVSALSALSLRVKLVTLVLVVENLICCGPLLHLSPFAFPSAFQISETIAQVFTAQFPQMTYNWKLRLFAAILKCRFSSS